jgi:hypothetical protein
MLGCRRTRHSVVPNSPDVGEIRAEAIRIARYGHRLIPAAVVLDSSCAGRSASKTRVNALMTRASIGKSASFKVMDCRVKPGNDGGWVGTDNRWSNTQKK